MGTEALAKQARRDIRRAFAPEASAELLRFVAGVKQNVADQVAMSHGALSNRITTLADEAKVEERFRTDLGEVVHTFTHRSFLQRLRWIVTGR